MACSSVHEKCNRHHIGNIHVSCMKGDASWGYILIYPQLNQMEWE